jgi:solute:Na+ symporter, SSS family
MLLIWLPSVFLGVIANQATAVPAIQTKLEARANLAAAGPDTPAEERARLRAQAGGDDVVLRLVDGYAPVWLAAILGAAVMAAVMASDSQILALSTMFAEDVFAFYGGRRRFGEAMQVRTGRIFVVVLATVAYVIALQVPQSIFEIATQYSFAGYAALAPLLVAALFWKGSTRWGALAATLWTAAAVTAVAIVQTTIPAPPAGSPVPVLTLGGTDLIVRASTGMMVFGLLPVVPMTIVSSVLIVVVSMLTPSARPNRATLAKYFPV